MYCTKLSFPILSAIGHKHVCGVLGCVARNDDVESFFLRHTAVGGVGLSRASCMQLSYLIGGGTDSCISRHRASPTPRVSLANEGGVATRACARRAVQLNGRPAIAAGSQPHFLFASGSSSAGGVCARGAHQALGALIKLRLNCLPLPARINRTAALLCPKSSPRSHRAGFFEVEIG